MTTIEIQKKILPETKPIYLMGAGEPIELLEAISRGVDIFDSRYPTQTARRGLILTWKGRMRIINTKYQTDKKPLDPECDCKICRHYSRAFIRYHLSQQEPVGMMLASYHNLYFLQRLMEKAREEIKKGTFLKFKNKMEKIYAKTRANGFYPERD